MKYLYYPYRVLTYSNTTSTSFTYRFNLCCYGSNIYIYSVCNYLLYTPGMAVYMNYISMHSRNHTAFILIGCNCSACGYTAIMIQYSLHAEFGVSADSCHSSHHPFPPSSTTGSRGTSCCCRSGAGGGGGGAGAGGVRGGGGGGGR